MKIISKFIMALGMLSVATAASAQIEEGDKQLFNHFGLGVSAGTDGIGFDVATTITPYVQARAGISFMPEIEVKDIDVDLHYGSDVDKGIAMFNQVTGENLTLPNNVQMGGKLNMTDFKLLFDLYPSKTSAWRLTVGFYAGKSKLLEAYTTNCEQQLEMITRYNQMVSAGDLPGVPGFEPQVIGVEVGDYLIKPDGPQARAYMKVNGFKPYIGIGSGRAISNKHRFSFSWDLGCQFWGTPTIYVMDEPLAKDSNIDGDGGFIKTVSKITVYPTLSFRFNGRIL